MYNGLPTRKQRFANHFKESGYRVVFLEPPFTYLGFLRGKRSQNGIKIEKITENFYVLHSFAWFPFFKKNVIFNNIDNHIFLNHIKKTFKELNFYPEIVWNYMPFLPKALRNLKAKIVYDCVDDHSAYPGLINPSFVDELEEQTVKLSDAVVVTNDTLKEKLSRYGKEPIILGNGVNWELFSKGLFNYETSIKKQIVYVGAIAEWFDLDLVKSIAKHYSNYEILIIGPVSIDASLLSGITNIKFTGRMTQEAFAPILRGSSVAIIPFKINKLTERIDPLKVYEYLAAGIPVVSTPVGGVKTLPVLIGSSNDEFIQKIKEAVENDSTEKRRNRSMEVKQFSWEMKYKIVDGIIEKL
jgi:glycosyltransferase involved in cell wall biosynthesis